MNGLQIVFNLVRKPRKTVQQLNKLKFYDCIILWGITIILIVLYFTAVFQSGLIDNYYTQSASLDRILLIELTNIVIFGYLLNMVLYYLLCKLVCKSIKFKTLIIELTPIFTIQIVFSMILGIISLFLIKEHHSIISQIIGFVVAIWGNIIVFELMVRQYNCKKKRATIVFLYTIVVYFFSNII